MGQDENLFAMRHSMAHILATAIQRKYPETKFGVGPVIEDGFYYDIDVPKTTLSANELSEIEQEMQRIIKEDQTFEHISMSIDDALSWSKDSGQPYKEELLNDLRREGTTIAKDLDATTMGVASDESQVTEVGFYRNGDFTDLCRGPHVTSTGQVGAFKLHKIAGAYWRGSEKNPQMQRIYGYGFATNEELQRYLDMQAQAKDRDHRKLGASMNLFSFSESVGQGLPLLHPRGEMIKHLLMSYMRQEEAARGYSYVSTPVLTQRALYERSGHADYYLENMYKTEVDEEGAEFFMKPMNCPHHHMIYSQLVTSYRDLPLRLSEHAGLYRYELSGTLTGLIRMRGPITQNDSHTYVTEDQLKDEFKDLLTFFSEIYETTGVDGYWFRLSLPDFSKDKYAGDKERWEWAANSIRACLEESGAEFVEVMDEAAFYGPKLDVQIKNVAGKEDSIATVQIDIVVPERMGISYKNDEDEDVYPVVIHKSIMGAFERFMGFLLEQTNGHLPFWLAPEQIRILSINDTVTDYIAEIKQVINEVVLMSPLKYNEIRFSIDDRNESLGRKIKEAQNLKIPLMIIVGPRDKQNRSLSLRYGDGKEETIEFDALSEAIKTTN